MYKNFHYIFSDQNEIVTAFALYFLERPFVRVLSKFPSILVLGGAMEFFSYERRFYESVDNRSLT